MEGRRVFFRGPFEDVFPIGKMWIFIAMFVYQRVLLFQQSEVENGSFKQTSRSSSPCMVFRMIHVKDSLLPMGSNGQSLVFGLPGWIS